jgi:hypothetical protein
METSLHQQLKLHYAGDSGATEVRLGRYRIDVVRGKELIEIQHGGLGVIASKIDNLAKSHKVRVVKPIVASKVIVKLDRPGGTVVSRRRSPKQGVLLDLFDDLVYFTKAFSNPRLTLEVVLVDIEEWRFPGHGRRRRWRQGDHQREDQHLVGIRETHTFRTVGQLWKLVPPGLPRPFHTGQLATHMGIERWVAQRMVYVLRHMSGLKQVGKLGNAWLYEPVGRRRKAA